jgi:hypothetical protein
MLGMVLVVAQPGWDAAAPEVFWNPRDAVRGDGGGPSGLWAPPPDSSPDVTSTPQDHAQERGDAGSIGGVPG